MRKEFVYPKPQEYIDNEDIICTAVINPESGKNPKPYAWIVVLFLTFALVVGYVWYAPDGEPQLAPDRKVKRDSSIGRTYERHRKKENCEQYVLTAARAMWFPVLKRGEVNATDSIWLNVGEVWRYGKTCFTDEIRYKGRIYYKDAKYKLTPTELQYSVEFRGTETECLVQEKTKIYNYPLLPECIKRARKLMRPAGNKIDN